MKGTTNQPQDQTAKNASQGTSKGTSTPNGQKNDAGHAGKDSTKNPSMKQDITNVDTSKNHEKEQYTTPHPDPAKQPQANNKITSSKK